MADAHDLLSRNRWQGVSLADLVNRELAPYATDGNTVVEGPEIVLAAAATQATAMVLHELARRRQIRGAVDAARPGACALAAAVERGRADEAEA